MGKHAYLFFGKHKTNSFCPIEREQCPERSDFLHRVHYNLAIEISATCLKDIYSITIPI